MLDFSLESRLRLFNEFLKQFSIYFIVYLCKVIWSLSSIFQQRPLIYFPETRTIFLQYSALVAASAEVTIVKQQEEEEEEEEEEEDDDEEEVEEKEVGDECTNLKFCYGSNAGFGNQLCLNCYKKLEID